MGIFEIFVDLAAMIGDLILGLLEAILSLLLGWL